MNVQPGTPADWVRQIPPAIICLQELAIAGVDQALAGKLRAEARQDPAATLTPWLLQPKAGGFAHRSVRRRLSRATAPTSETMSDPVAAMVARIAFPPPALLRWLDRIGSLSRRHRPGNPGQNELLNALIQTAYRQPGFFVAIAHRLRTWLETRVLFHPGGMPVVQLSVTGCVLLASTVVSGQHPTGTRFREVAADLCKTPGWAGFWEQWLLSLSRRANSGALPNAIGTLPLIDRGVGALTGGDREEDPRCPPDWRATAPPFAGALLRGTP